MNVPEQRRIPQRIQVDPGQVPSLGQPQPRDVRPFPKPNIVAPGNKSVLPTESVQAPTAVPARQEAPRPTVQDAYKYLARLVEEGQMPAAQAMRIMGQSDEVREQLLGQLRNQERQQEQMLKDTGVYEENLRMKAIKQELDQDKTPLPEFNERTWGWRAGNDLHRTKASPLERMTATKRADIFITHNADGTETRILDRAPGVVQQVLPIETKPGVYEETYSAPDKHGNRTLLDRKRIGEHIKANDTVNPLYPELPQSPYYITSEKTAQLQQEATSIQLAVNEKIERRKIEEEHGIRLGEVVYTPTDKEQKQYGQKVGTMRNMLQGTLNLAKENKLEIGIYGAELLALSLASSLFYFGLPNALIPGGLIAKSGWGYLGLTLGGLGINALNKGPRPTGQSLRIQAQTVGVLMIPALASLFGAAVAPVAYGLGGAAVGAFLLKKGIDRVGLMMEADKYAKQHPEIEDPKQVTQIIRAQRAEKRNEEFRTNYKKDHAATFIALKNLNPQASDETVLQAIYSLEKIHKQQEQRTLAALPEAQYSTKVMGAQLLPVLVSLPTIGIVLFATGILGAPAIPFAVGSSIISSLSGLAIRQKLLGRLKEEIKQENPELLNGNGKK